MVKATGRMRGDDVDEGTAGAYRETCFAFL